MRTIAEVQPPPVAVEYAREVRAKLGLHVRQIILFGSQARGDAREGSDYDFIVVVDKRTRTLRKLISEAGCELLNRTDSLCAALVYDDDQWELVRGSPLGWNAEKEGVLL
jgi:predicted nucleotidyltransferase